MKPFNPLEDVPTTDGQAEIAIKYGKHGVCRCVRMGTVLCIPAARRRNGNTGV